VETKTFNMVADMTALLLYLETKYPNANTFAATQRLEKSKIFNESEAKHSRITVTTSSTSRLITQKLCDLAEPVLSKEEYDNYRAAKLRELEEKNYRSRVVSPPSKRRPSSTTKQIPATFTNRNEQTNIPKKSSVRAANWRELKEKNTESRIVSPSSERRPSSTTKRIPATFTNRNEQTNIPKSAVRAAKWRELKEKNTESSVVAPHRKQPPSIQIKDIPKKSEEPYSKSRKLTVSDEPVFSRKQYDVYRAAKSKQLEYKNIKSRETSPSSSRKSQKSEESFDKDEKYSRPRVPSPSSNRRPQKAMAPPHPSSNKHTRSKQSPESSSSAHSYYNFTPKLVINNQFINTNMSTFKSSERSHYTSSHVLSDDDVRDSLPVAPPPPKVDFHAVRESELKRNRREKDYDDCYEKRAKLPDETNLTYSVSAFLDKLTDKFGN
jgi:hypothetical protein